MISIIAGATCREAVRSRSFAFLLVIYVLGLLVARVVSWVASTEQGIVLTDLVFSLQSIIGVLVAVATGTALVHNEVVQRTLYTVLSRPMARWHFVIGKFLGLASALVIGQVAMLALGLVWVAINGGPVSGALVIAGALVMLEVVVMAAISLTLTSLTSPLLAAVLSLAAFALGHAVHELPGLMHHLDGWQVIVATTLAAAIPNLGMFTYRNRAVYGEPMIDSDWLAVPYGMLWVLLLVVMTQAVFQRKQL